MSKEDLKLATLNPKLYKIVKDPEQKRFQFTLEDVVNDEISNEIPNEPLVPTKSPEIAKSTPSTKVPWGILSSSLRSNYLHITVSLRKSLVEKSKVNSVQEPCTKCFVVHLSKFAILQTT